MCRRNAHLPAPKTSYGGRTLQTDSASHTRRSVSARPEETDPRPTGGPDGSESAIAQAIAMFHRERVRDALAVALQAWAGSDAPLDALGWAVKLRLYLGDEMGSDGLCTPLAMATAENADGAIAQLESLLLLGRDEDAWDAFRRATEGAALDSAPAARRARVHHLGACAARRLGGERHARILWRDALRLTPGLAAASRNLEPARTSDLARLPDVLDLEDAIPAAWCRRLLPGMPQSAAATDAPGPSNSYLRAVHIAGSDTLRRLTVLVLVERARRGETDASNVLRGLSGIPVGTPDERLALLRSLNREGLLAADEAADFWDGYEVRRIKAIDACRPGASDDVQGGLSRAAPPG
jgi:hypothetical protein